MRYFLLVYDRPRGRLLVDREFSDPVEAGWTQYREERTRLAEPDVEVVVISAASRDIVQRNHSRYFCSTAEIARNAPSVVAVPL